MRFFAGVRENGGCEYFPTRICVSISSRRVRVMLVGSIYVFDIQSEPELQRLLDR